MRLVLGVVEASVGGCAGCGGSASREASVGGRASAGGCCGAGGSASAGGSVSREAIFGSCSQ